MFVEQSFRENDFNREFHSICSRVIEDYQGDMAVAQQCKVDSSFSRDRVNSLWYYDRITHGLSSSVSSLVSLNSTLSLRMSRSSPSLSVFKREVLDRAIECIDFDNHDIMVILKARKEALEKMLRSRREELKLLCLREGELTGEVPPDIPLTAGEAPPTFKRRVGTSFALNNRLIEDFRSNNEEDLAKLELECEIQNSITMAVLKLASDKTVKRSVRKQRKLAHQRALLKLKDLQQKLSVLKRQSQVVSVEKSSQEGETISLKEEDNGLLYTSSKRKIGNLIDKDCTISTVSPLSHSTGLPISMTANHGSAPPRRKYGVFFPGSSFQTSVLGRRRSSFFSPAEQRCKSESLNLISSYPDVHQFSQLHGSYSQPSCSENYPYDRGYCEGGDVLSTNTNEHCYRSEPSTGTSVFSTVSTRTNDQVFANKNYFLHSSPDSRDDKIFVLHDSLSEGQLCRPDRPNSPTFTPASNNYSNFLHVPNGMQIRRKYSDPCSLSVGGRDRKKEYECNRGYNEELSSPDMINYSNEKIDPKDQWQSKTQSNSHNQLSKNYKTNSQLVLPMSEKKFIFAEKNDIETELQCIQLSEHNFQFSKEKSYENLLDFPKKGMNYLPSNKQLASPHRITSRQLAGSQICYSVKYFGFNNINNCQKETRATKDVSPNNFPINTKYDSSNLRPLKLSPKAVSSFLVPSLQTVPSSPKVSSSSLPFLQTESSSLVSPPTTVSSSPKASFSSVSSLQTESSSQVPPSPVSSLQTVQASPKVLSSPVLSLQTVPFSSVPHPQTVSPSPEPSTQTLPLSPENQINRQKSLSSTQNAIMPKRRSRSEKINSIFSFCSNINSSTKPNSSSKARRFSYFHKSKIVSDESVPPSSNTNYLRNSIFPTNMSNSHSHSSTFGCSAKSKMFPPTKTGSNSNLEKTKIASTQPITSSRVNETELFKCSKASNLGVSPNLCDCSSKSQNVNLCPTSADTKETNEMRQAQKTPKIIIHAPEEETTEKTIC
ncbi:uncharacterized protein LOC106472386 isoform X2 [Limulus polyphemus]|uniref:Uncharacterized protein LOC106472386 isoform X2 n=1 Tax=Limulus polyphemus TaxID=6850 RepID=A0ABM1TLC3_LIMPO|nr:uncharacterized protein LOC106472386 isoform X2 [Limulus polyphemus]